MDKLRIGIWDVLFVIFPGSLATGTVLHVFPELQSVSAALLVRSESLFLFSFVISALLIGLTVGAIAFLLSTLVMSQDVLHGMNDILQSKVLARLGALYGEDLDFRRPLSRTEKNRTRKVTFLWLCESALAAYYKTPHRNWHPEWLLRTTALTFAVCGMAFALNYLVLPFPQYSVGLDVFLLIGSAAGCLLFALWSRYLRKSAERSVYFAFLAAYNESGQPKGNAL